MFRASFIFFRQRLSRALLLFLLTVFFSPVFSFAQTLHFRNYSANDGLPFVEVYTIFQDSKGYLWSGGYGGLSRFDGKVFTNFSPRNGLPNHWVTSITDDKEGNLWVGTIEGASRYHNGNFKTFGEKDGLPDKYINSVFRDHRNVLWFGTAKGVAYFDGTGFKSPGGEGPGKIPVRCFYEEPDSSRIWMGTASGVFLFENGKFTHYVLPGLFNSTVNAITRDRNGRILAGTADGIFVLENNRFGILLTPASMEMPSVNALITDKGGIVWIGAGNGLYSFDGKNFTHYSVSPDKNGDIVVSLFIDYENSLWLGTHAGLYRYRGKGFESYSVSDGLDGNFDYGITRDNSGSLWVCSGTNGIYRYDPAGAPGKKFVSIARKDGLASDKTNACIVGPDGALYVGTDRGLNRISNGTITTYTRKDGLFCDTVNCLMLDHKGRLWMGGAMGITVDDNGKFRSYAMPDSSGVTYDTWFLFEDDKGIIWIGTYLGGLYTFDPEGASGKNFTDERAALHLKADSYFSICEDKDGRMYFATLDGIFIYDAAGGKEVTRLTEADGLSSELVYCMCIDRNNFLWIGSNQGLSRFDISTYAKTGAKVISTFGEEEGFTGVECNSNGAFVDADSTIWFGTVNGLIHYSPKKFRYNNAYTKTNLTGIKLFYSDTTLSPGTTLNYSDNNLSFEYVGICLANPLKVRYRYMLTGFDTGWSPPTKERVARYSNLPPGNYTFRVISCNNEGVWNNSPAEFSFVIATPFWQRPWFWLLLTFISVMIISAGIVLRIRQVKRKERIETETKVAMAKNELKALRAQMNPHFVFNSLNSIQHFILTNKSADAGKYLNKFARLMRVILNNSEKSVITISEELEYLRLYLELEEMRFEGKFSWTIDIAEDVDTDYFEIPAMLLQPYVENAILHGLMPKEAPGHLKITIRLQGNTLVCSIEDDGIGREKARTLRQLSQKKDHKSLGMKITHDRLELINRLHGSHLGVTITDLYDDRHLAAGTRVDIFIPVS